jgi:DNA-binding MarR family transcriptional regulator
MAEGLLPTESPRTGEDDFIAALAAVEDAVLQAAEIARKIVERAEHIRAMRREGMPYREIVPNEERPLIVELLTANLELLSGVGSRLRRAEARALYQEGLTMDEIATLFRVSRQRVAVLLRSP